jgi:hypothetical protein
MRENYFNSFVVFLKHLVDATIAPLAQPRNATDSWDDNTGDNTK